MTARKWIMGTVGGAAAVVLVTASALAQTAQKSSTVGTPRATTSVPTMPPAAVVNGEPITVTELESVLQLMPKPPRPLTEMQKKQMRADALDMLIDDVLIRQYLNKNAPRITQEEFTKEYQTLLTALKSRNMTLEDFLKDIHQTEAHLRLDIVKKLQWDKFIHQHISEAALKKYYDDNRDFYDQVTVQVSHILFRLPPNAPQAERAQARARLAGLRQQILAKQISFADAARKYSQCPSAARGGDIGFIMRKWVVDEPVARAAFALKVGEVSDVVESEAGLQLLTVTARNPGQPSNFEKIKDLVRENMAKEMWDNLVTQQRKVARIEVKQP